MKKTLLFLIIILLIFPTVVSAYALNKNYRIDKEFILNGVDCIGVDAQENIYLQNLGFRKTAIQVYTNKGEFLHSISIPTTGTYYFKVDEYAWVALAREDTILIYSLDGILVDVPDIDEDKSKEDIEYKSVNKNGITYRIKGALGFVSIWKEHNGSNEKLFNVPIKHLIGNVLFIIGFIAFAIVGLYLLKKRRKKYQRPEYSELALKRENYNRHEQSH